MTTRFILLLALMVSTVNSYADDSSNSCNALLENGIQNTQISALEYDYLATVSDEYCHTSYSSLSASKNASFAAVVKTIPINLSGSSSDTSTKHANFCRDFKSLTASRSTTFLRTTSIFQGSLDAWNRCQQLETKSLFIQPSFPTDKVSVGFSMATRSSAQYKFTGVDTHNMNCTIGGRAVRAAENMTLGSTATVMQCTRQSNPMKLHNQDVEFFPAANVNLKTGEGNTLVEFAEMIKFAGKDRFAQIDTELAATKRTLSNLMQSLATVERSDRDTVVQTPSNVPGGWTSWASCPAGTFVSAVSVFDRDTGSKCMPCISHVRVSCTALPKAQ